MFKPTHFVLSKDRQNDFPVVLHKRLGPFSSVVDEDGVKHIVLHRRLVLHPRVETYSIEELKSKIYSVEEIKKMTEGE